MLLPPEKSAAPCRHNHQAQQTADADSGCFAQHQQCKRLQSSSAGAALHQRAVGKAQHVAQHLLKQVADPQRQDRGPNFIIIRHIHMCARVLSTLLNRSLPRETRSQGNTASYIDECTQCILHVKAIASWASSQEYM